MNQRQRKKWLKKNKKWVDPKECWNLDITIAEFVLPRLKIYKKQTNGYPSLFNNIEEWKVTLDKMILAFEYVLDDKWEFKPEFDFCLHGFSEEFEGTKIIKLKTEESSKKYQNYLREAERRQMVIREGMILFAKYYQSLWW